MNKASVAYLKTRIKIKKTVINMSWVFLDFVFINLNNKTKDTNAIKK